MDLAELKFVVDTKELETAATRVAELGTAVSKLNKPMQDLTKESAKTNKELSKAEEAAAKAALAQHKLEQAQTKSTDATTKSASVLERQNLILEYMAQGNSKGQASILATAKAAGALDDEMIELNNTLKTQRTLIGGDPFDKSIGLMQKLQNEYKTTNEVSNLFNKNLGLTEKQMVDLAREKERLIALYGIEGRSLDGLAAEYDQLISKSVMINQANDARTNSMKAQVKTQNDAAKANEYIAKEMERVNRLTESNGTLTSATNNKLIKFEQSLKASGMSAADAAAKLELYKQKVLAAQKAGGDRQIDYLSRALGPQITDIAVGLATGQAPLTILLQQGGQLRDQFALAGVAGADMGKMLIQATKSMVVSVKDVGVAIGSAFVGAIAGAGTAVVGFATQITGANVLLDAFRAKIIATAGANSIALKAFDMLGKGVIAMAGVITFTAIASLVAFGVALSDVIKEENALNRALNLNGAAMGVSLDMAYDAARGMEELGVSTGTALSVLTEMANVGGMSADSLEMVATTAKAMKTAFDIPIEDTVKQFKELQEKPTESLTKLAIKLGTIPVEILKQVDAYERAGNSIEAAKLATNAYADAGKDAADRTVENFGVITRLGISIAEIWNKTWDSILGIGRKGTLEDQIAEIRASLPDLAAKVSPDADVNDYDAQQLELAQSKLRSLLDQAAAEKNLAVERKAGAEAAKKFEDDKKKRDEAERRRKSDIEKIQGAFNSELAKARDHYMGQVGALDHLTKADTELLKLRSDPMWSWFNSEQRAYIESLYQAASAHEKSLQGEKDTQEALELKNRLLGKSEGLGKDYYNTIAKINELAAKGKFGADEVKELTAALQAATPEARRLAAAQASTAKTLADIAAERKDVAEESAGDFKTADQKASIKNLSDYRKSVALADAEFAKQVADAGANIDLVEFLGYKQIQTEKKALAKDRYDSEERLLTDSYKQQQAYHDAFRDLFKGMGDAIVDFALTGKTSFGDMVKSILVGLIKMQVQMQMMNAFKAFIPGFAFADGGAFTSGGVQAFAKGGTFTNSVVDSPTMFKFAKGAGVMGEAGPEAIMPLRRGSDGSLGVVASGGSSGNVSVQVINNSNAQATTNETVDSKGNRKIEVVIGDMTAGEISRSGSASQKSIRSTFGIQPQLIRR